MGLLEALGLKPAAASPNKHEAKAVPAAASAAGPMGAVAQLVGANALSPIFRPRFGLESHLPWLLEPGPDGNPPKSYTSIAANNGTGTPERRVQFDKRYASQLTKSFQFLVTYYGQNVEGYNMFMWNGVRMNGLPVVAGFSAERTESDAREIWDYAYSAYGLTSKPVLTVASGNSGWTTLEASWKLIATPEGKVVWLSSIDAPSYPKEEPPNEAAVLLMLAHPGYDTGRKPLAYFSAPQVVVVKDMKDEQRHDKEAPRVAALRLAVAQVCTTAGLSPSSIASIATDCGRNTPTASKRLGEVGAALHDLSPDLDLVHQRIDMVALLGDLGANTVNVTLLMAAYAAHQRNHPVLYVSNVDPEAARAMLVFPPLNHTPPDPNRKFPDHPHRGQWYAPWWGQRQDGKKDF